MRQKGGKVEGKHHYVASFLYLKRRNVLMWCALLGVEKIIKTALHYLCEQLNESPYVSVESFTNDLRFAIIHTAGIAWGRQIESE